MWSEVDLGTFNNNCVNLFTISSSGKPCTEYLLGLKHSSKPNLNYTVLQIKLASNLIILMPAISILLNSVK